MKYGGSYILDNTEIFSNQQAITATAISENVIKLLDAAPTPAEGTPPGGGYGKPVLQSVAQPRRFQRATTPILIQVTQAFTASGAATLTVTLESDSVAGLSDSPTVHWTSDAIGKATLIAGYKFPLFYLPEGTYEQYLGLRFTVATGPMTAGKIKAMLNFPHEYNPA